MVVVPGPGVAHTGNARVAQSHMESYFNTLGIPLRNPNGVKLEDASRYGVRAMAQSEDADLVAVVLVDAVEIDRLGYSVRIRAEVRCKIYDAEGDIFVAAKAVDYARDSDARAATDAAVAGALEALGESVADQMIARVGKTAITRRVTISGLDNLRSLTELQRSLRAQRGISEVRTVAWSGGSGVAKMTVYMTPEVVDNLGSYIVGAPGLGIDITYDGDGVIVGQGGEVTQ